MSSPPLLLAAAEASNDVPAAPVLILMAFGVLVAIGGHLYGSRHRRRDGIFILFLATAAMVVGGFVAYQNEDPTRDRQRPCRSQATEHGRAGGGMARSAWSPAVHLLDPLDAAPVPVAPCAAAARVRRPAVSCSRRRVPPARLRRGRRCRRGADVASGWRRRRGALAGSCLDPRVERVVADAAVDAVVEGVGAAEAPRDDADLGRARPRRPGRTQRAARVAAARSPRRRRRCRRRPSSRGRTRRR